MKKSITMCSLVVVFLISLIIFLPSSDAGAKTEIAAIEGMKYNVNFSLHDNLKSLMGRNVYVTLSSGKTFAGYIKEVGDHLVHLEKLDGKSYFDALIRIEDISAIDAKFRDVQR